MTRASFGGGFSGEGCRDGEGELVIHAIRSQVAAMSQPYRSARRSYSGTKPGNASLASTPVEASVGFCGSSSASAAAMKCHGEAS